MKQLDSFTPKINHTKSYDFKCSTISEKVDDSTSKKETGTGCCCLGYRHLVAFWCFFYFAMVNCHITVVSVAIVAMVNHTGITGGHERNSSTDSCPLLAAAENATQEHKIDGPFKWSSQIQGQIMGLASIGYIISNIFAGRIAEILGPKRILLSTDFFVSLCTIISPFAAEWSVYALIAFQIAKGFFQGFLIPSAFVIMANWFPRSERGILSSFVACGIPFGALMSTVGAGLLCDALGWRSAFLFMGGFNIVGSIIFACTFYEVPKIHPYISKEELLLITKDQENDMSLKRPPAPWKEILTSIPVHALSIGKFGYYWSLRQFISMHPTFMGTVLHFSMTKNGLFTSLLFLFMIVGSIVSMIISQWQRRKKFCNVNILRKGFSSISALGFCICLVGVILSKCDASMNMVFCGLAALFGGLGMSGTLIAAGDMSPTFSGSITGLTSFIGAMASIVLPIVSGALTKHETLEEWHTVFYTHISIILTCALIFQVFGSAHIQPWDSRESKNTAEQQPQKVSTQNESNPSTTTHM